MGSIFAGLNPKLACRWTRIWPGLLLAAVLAACAPGESAIPSPTAALTDQIVAEEIIPTPLPTAAEVDSLAEDRERLVQQGIIAWGIDDEAVIEVMRSVPRHEFVPDEFRDQAYDNHPLPIGYGQTISQPYIVALMTMAANVAADDQVLEVGTGSGYQAAVLAELVDHVYTIEIIGPLAESAQAALERTGYDNVTVRHGDGYFGWEELAPFDAIVVTAAPDHIPQPLVNQLKVGGHLVIPVGPVGGYQTLWLVTRISEDEVETVDLGGVRFVPLTRE